MAISKIRVVANCDMTTIVWQLDDPIPECRGFALERQVAGAQGDAGDDFVRTWVGFEGGTHQPGESQPSTVWPIQRCIWSDYLVSQGQKVKYRVIPMVGPAASLQKGDESTWSSWTDWTVVATEKTAGFHAYFNRGIVPAQFLARQADNSKDFDKMLTQDIRTPTSKNRLFLAGPLRDAILSLLAQAQRDGVQIFAALYELNDPEILAALKALGSNCNLILGSGAFSRGKPDENAVVRKDLRENSSVQLVDRLVKSPHFAHNKFIVFCDSNSSPATVWTGSLNCTVTGLCTQVNNGILIDSPHIAGAYKQRWDELKAAGSGYPPELAQNGSTPAHDVLNRVPITAWNAPCLKYVDLADAAKYIHAAEEGVLFLMFNPGSGDGQKKAFSLLQDIEALDPEKLFIHGVINQEQPSGKGASLQLVNRGTKLPAASMDEIVPKPLQDATKNWFHQEYRFAMVMIHSKVIVVDPFGSNPVVMTGSHNLGPKASAENDDNLVIIENAPGLAEEYAVNILGVYDHYQWLYSQSPKGKKAVEPVAAQRGPSFDGLKDSDQWQQNWLQGPRLRDVNFWLGNVPQSAPPAQPASPAQPVGDRPAPTPRKARTTTRRTGATAHRRPRRK
jgi:phosphatidylserine/phosphatidylglycerophosphate/cardiolipin synthase-like enzyme